MEKYKKQQSLKLFSMTILSLSELLFYLQKNQFWLQLLETTEIPKWYHTSRHNLQRCCNAIVNLNQHCKTLLKPMLVISLLHLPIFIVCFTCVMGINQNRIGHNNSSHCHKTWYSEMSSAWGFQLHLCTSLTYFTVPMSQKDVSNEQELVNREDSRWCRCYSEP